MDWGLLLKQFLSFRIFIPIVPIFVAIDVPGILPIFISLALEMEITAIKMVVRQSVLTAFRVGIGCLAAGKSVFTLLGVSVSDFKIAGGILLFILSVVDLIFPERTRTFPRETLGVMAIGIPLIVGPAVLTLLLITVDVYGYFSTIVCLILNLLIVWFVFSQSRRIMQLLGEGGAKGIAKVASLLPAAFAVMMIRTGLTEWAGLYLRN
jgi:multiple antibiotic resistance protein